MARHAQIKINPVKAAVESANAGSFYLTIVASNGETLATSELYVNQGNAARAEGDLVDAMRDIVAQADARDLEAAEKADEEQLERDALERVARWEAGEP